MKITVDRTVIQQALEALNYVMRHGPAVQKAKDLLRTALAQPEQEPVAVARVDDLERGGRVRALAMGLALDAPLYTTPPQHKPLSDDEIQALWEKAFDSGSSPRDFVRAIEAAHGIEEQMK